MIIKNFLSLLNRYKTDLPTFTIVGVGPGDPSLLTIAAVNAIKKAKVIVFPISDDNKKSFAAEIVKKYTKFKKNIPIIFPMARRDFDPDEIWSNAVEKIVKFIKNGESVVLLCLGDTSLFASSSIAFSSNILVNLPQIPKVAQLLYFPSQNIVQIVNRKLHLHM